VTGTAEDAVLTGIAGLAHDQRRLEIDVRRVGLDTQRLDATVQLMGTSVAALSEEVRQLGAFVQRLETKLDLGRQVMDRHLHTIMNHIGVSFFDTLHSDYPDRQSADRHPSPAPGKASDQPERAAVQPVFEGAAVERDPLGEPG
jgi:hypothetical protein